MTKVEDSPSFWPVAPKTPRYYLLLQILALSLGYSAILTVSFLEGAVGSFNSLGLFLLVNMALGIIAGTSSTSLARGVLVTFVSLVAAVILTFGVLTLPANVGAIDGSLVDVVVVGMTIQLIYLVLTFPIAFLAIILGSGLHDRLGLPED